MALAREILRRAQDDMKKKRMVTIYPLLSAQDYSYLVGGAIISEGDSGFAGG
jgi:hypothetical protein